MNVVYVDTSVLIALLFNETIQAKKIKKVLNEADELISSSLLEAEYLSCLKRDGIDEKSGLSLLAQISLIVPDRSLLPELREVLATGYQKGADAFHLACALYLDSKREHIIFLTLDQRQGKAAQLLGFKAL